MVSIPAYGSKADVAGYCHGGYCKDFCKASMHKTLLVHGSGGLPYQDCMVLGGGKGHSSREACIVKENGRQV